jgi:paraquat-inducible protein B
MSARPSATAIGGFLLGAIVLIVGGVSFFGGALFGDRADVRHAAVIFTGSVKGLNVGAPVTLRGVKVGEVRQISLHYIDERKEFVTPVIVSINVADLGFTTRVLQQKLLDPLVERGLRAQLKTQSILTGLLYIDLDFLPEQPPRYVDYDAGVTQIPTAPTELEAILARVSEIDVQAFVQRADSALRALEAILSDPETRRLPGTVNATLEEVRELAADANANVATLTADAGRLVHAADGTLASTRAEIEFLGERVEKSLAAVDTLLASVQRTSDELGYAVSDRSPALHELEEAAQEIGRAARALQELADVLAREPESLVRGRDEDPEEEP